MSANELLFQIVRETGRANALISDLAQHAAENEVVLVHEVRGVARELERHLRDASCAATALHSLAQGNQDPKRG